MKISGFSYVRNGFDYGVPFIEAIQSILPICDEFIAVVGDSSDGTREAIAQLAPDKIKIIDTVWDMSLAKGGKVFAIQTNTGIKQLTGNWAFHIQADEVIHEKDLPTILHAIQDNDANRQVDGFILPFLHFWGDYQHIRNSRRIHKHEVRIFRNEPGVFSYRDSQGFRKYLSEMGYANQTDPGSKLVVKKIDAPIFHYNGIRPPSLFRKKAQQMGEFYKSKEESQKELEAVNYSWDNVDRVIPFTDSHPAVMQSKINGQDWKYTFDPAKAKWKLKDRLIQPIEDLLGFKIGEYKNYRLIK